MKILGLCLGLALTGSVTAGGLSVESETFRSGAADQEGAVGLRSPDHAGGGWVIDLPPQPRAKSASVSEWSEQVGYGQDLPADVSAVFDATTVAWNVASDGGRTAVFKVTSAGAEGIRGGFAVYEIPDSVELRFFSPDIDGSRVFAVTGAEIKRILARDGALRDPDEEQPLLYWSPIVEGPTLGIELYLPPEVEPAQVRGALSKISHIYNLPRSGAKSAGAKFGVNTSQECHLDVSCYLDTWRSTSNAVARILYTLNDGSSAACSGTLINDLDEHTQIPYFLTAGHCISSQSVASTMQSYWFFHTVGCGGPVPTSTFKVLGGGALLLDHVPEVDMTLLRLESDPPDGTQMAGWDSNPVPAGTKATGIHHPAADLQKITFFNVEGFGGCLFDLHTDFLSCRDYAADDGNFLLLHIDQGFVEPGSSGSALFLNRNHKIVGTATAMSWQETDGNNYPNCGESYLKIMYGRFDVAFEKSLHQWLAATASSACNKLPGTWDYCADPACGPCDVDMGDCDSNSECKTGLECVDDVGADYGWPTPVDVCRVPTDAAGIAGCFKTPGSWNYCSDPACGPCDDGMGDCDSDSECKGDLVCLDNAGAAEGFLSSVDVCGSASEARCDLKKGDWGYCSKLGCGPCNAGEGDCDSDADCADGLVCARNAGAAYGLPSNMDVCEAPSLLTCTKQPGDWGYCSDPACGPCGEGQGDCDTDDDCNDGLVCKPQGGEALGLPAEMDVCTAP